eukprot:7061025-Prymnesium_polylepis.1
MLMAWSGETSYILLSTGLEKSCGARHGRATGEPTPPPMRGDAAKCEPLFGASNRLLTGAPGGGKKSRAAGGEGVLGRAGGAHQHREAIEHDQPKHDAFERDAIHDLDRLLAWEGVPRQADKRLPTWPPHAQHRSADSGGGVGASRCDWRARQFRRQDDPPYRASRDARPAAAEQHPADSPGLRLLHRRSHPQHAPVCRGRTRTLRGNLSGSIVAAAWSTTSINWSAGFFGTGAVGAPSG